MGEAYEPRSECPINAAIEVFGDRWSLPGRWPKLEIGKDSRVSADPESFVIAIGDDVLSDLRARLRGTRWPDAAPGAPWSQGTDLAYLKGFCAEWADRFDWRRQERRLNAYPQFITDIAGARVDFVHHRSGKPALLLTHGWPSAFVEMLPLVDRLSDEFDLIVPSLPGYGFSSVHRGSESIRPTQHACGWN